MILAQSYKIKDDRMILQLSSMSIKNSDGINSSKNLFIGVCNIQWDASGSNDNFVSTDDYRWYIHLRRQVEWQYGWYNVDENLSWIQNCCSCIRIGNKNLNMLLHNEIRTIISSWSTMISLVIIIDDDRTINYLSIFLKMATKHPDFTNLTQFYVDWFRFIDLI